VFAAESSGVGRRVAHLRPSALLLVNVPFSDATRPSGARTRSGAIRPSGAALPADAVTPYGTRIPGGLVATSVDEQQAWLAADARSHGFTRRSLLKGALGGAGALVLGQLALQDLGLGRAFAGTAPGPSGLVVLGRHLSFQSNPATGLDATNSMNVGALLSSAALPDTATAVPAGVKIFVDVEEGGSASPYSGSYSEALAVTDIRSLTSTGQLGPVANLTQTELWIHLEMTGLAANTLYHYRFRVQEADGSTGYTTADAWFTTAPKPGTLTPFTFTAFADQGNTPLTGTTTGNYTTLPSGNGNATPQGSTSDQFDDYYYDTNDSSGDAVEVQTDFTPALTMTRSVAAADPSFHLLAGDICYADNTGEGTVADKFDPTGWEYYVTQIESTAAFTPWMFAVGNHDMEAMVMPPATDVGALPTHGYYGQGQRLDFPADRPANCPCVYAFRYQNVAVLSLDANDFSNEIPTNYDYSGWLATETGNQVTWLESHLAAYRADPTIDFIVCFFHECAYTSNANHGSDTGVRSELTPIFDEYQVDLVIQGHCHQYERSDPVRGGVTTRDAPYIAPAGGGGTVVYPATDGTSYVTIGSGGRPRYHWTGGSADGADSSIEGDRWGLIDPATNNPEHGSVDLGTLPGTYGAPDQPGSNVLTKSNLDGGTTSETPTWTSQSRYLNYAYLVIDVDPAPVGQTTTMRVSTHKSDDPSPAGIVDQVTFARTAGAAGVTPALAESPSALLLPVAGAVVLGAGYLATRDRRRRPDTAS
jgi:hypothetical protein